MDHDRQVMIVVTGADDTCPDRQIAGQIEGCRGEFGHWRGRLEVEHRNSEIHVRGVDHVGIRGAGLFGHACAQRLVPCYDIEHGRFQCVGVQSADEPDRERDVVGRGVGGVHLIGQPEPCGGR